MIRYAYHRPDIDSEAKWKFGKIITVAYDRDVKGDAGVVLYAYTICNPKDEFNKEKGRAKALERLGKNLYPLHGADSTGWLTEADIMQYLENDNFNSHIPSDHVCNTVSSVSDEYPMSKKDAIMRLYFPKGNVLKTIKHGYLGGLIINKIITGALTQNV